MEDVVSLILVDFTREQERSSNLFQKLKRKIVHYRKSIPFSMKFTPFEIMLGILHQPGSENTKLKNPADVKISFNHNCICVADEFNKRIQFFNLQTHEYFHTFNLEEGVSAIMIEENFNGKGDDAIYFGYEEKELTLKFNIRDLLDKTVQSHVPIWQVKKKMSGSMTCLFDSEFMENVVVRWCDESLALSFFLASNGKLVREVNLENMCTNPDVIAVNSETMMATNVEDNTLIIIKKGRDGWYSEETAQLEKKWSHPLSMAVDPYAERVFVSDYGNHRIVVVDFNGHFVDAFVESGLHPFGIVYDCISGLLYVTDQSSSVVKIFK